MTKETIVKTVTPKGEIAWVTITGEGKENQSGKLQYKADIILDPKNAEHKAYLNSIDAYWEANKPASFQGTKKKPKSLGYYLCDKKLDKDGVPLKDEELDQFIYDPKGRVTVSFKTGTTFPDGSMKKVKVRNAKGKVVDLGETQIGNGSIGYLAGAMDIYKADKAAGVTLYLDEIKLTKLVEFSGNDAFAGHKADEDEDSWTGEDDSPFEGNSEEKVRL